MFGPYTAVSFAFFALNSRISAGFALKFTPIEQIVSMPSALMEACLVRGVAGVAGGVSGSFSLNRGMNAGVVFKVMG